MGGSHLYCASKCLNLTQRNNPNHKALNCNQNWRFLSLPRNISHHFTFSSHLSDSTSNHLQSLSVKPHFCCPEASHSLPAWTQECVKIKGDFCHYPVWTPKYMEGEGRIFPEKIHRNTISRAAWNPIMTAEEKEKKKKKKQLSYCCPERLAALQQICVSWQPRDQEFAFKVQSKSNQSSTLF